MLDISVVAGAQQLFGTLARLAGFTLDPVYLVWGLTLILFAPLVLLEAALMGDLDGATYLRRVRHALVINLVSTLAVLTFFEQVRPRLVKVPPGVFALSPGILGGGVILGACWVLIVAVEMSLLMVLTGLDARQAIRAAVRCNLASSVVFLLCAAPILTRYWRGV